MCVTSVRYSSIIRASHVKRACIKVQEYTHTSVNKTLIAGIKPRGYTAVSICNLPYARERGKRRDPLI